MSELPRPPRLGLMMLESRVPLEYAAMLASGRLLRRLGQRHAGQGRPVLVFPGLGTNDLSTRPLRRLLADLGYHAHPWALGFNFGPRQGVIERCQQQLERLWREHGQPVSLLGWSLGGLYARELAKLHPEWTRCVITLGTPFTGHPKATNAWRFYQLLSGLSVDDPRLLAQLRRPPPLPTSSIYSRSDGVVSWRCSVMEPGPLAENIEVQASHLGLAINPLALYAVVDRLAQDPAHWQPFDPRGARRWFYRTP